MTHQDMNEGTPRKRNASVWSCDFESAIAAAGFGKFNAYLVVVSTITGLISVFEVRSMPYIVPAAQCDLNLNINEKAMLNSIPLLGMVISSFWWGLMGDILGRKKLIIIICALDFACWIMAASAQSFIVLLLARFFGGLVSSGIYPSLASYLTEIHGVKHRSIMQLFLGNIFGLGDLLLALMALGILTNNDTYKVSNVVIHPWNAYLLICALLPFLSGIGFFLLPESPKFLMSTNQNEKAINVFQSIYCINTKKGTKEDYPVKSLKKSANIVIDLRDSSKSVINGCCSPVALFLEGNNMKNIFLSVFAQCFVLMGLNSFLLWMPQIFQEMEFIKSENSTATFCHILNKLQNVSEFAEYCEEDLTSSSKTYLCCMVIATSTIILFGISGFVINTLGKKRLLYILGISSTIAIILLMYENSIITMIAISSVICAFGNIGFNAVVAIVADIFPTNLRAMSVSLTMMVGRLGGVIGTFIFPIFMVYGCLPVLICMACTNLGARWIQNCPTFSIFEDSWWDNFHTISDSSNYVAYKVWLCIVFFLPDMEESETSKNTED